MSIMRGYHEAIIRKVGKMSETCHECNGNGVLLNGSTCFDCFGTGYIPTEEKLVPAEIIQDAQVSAGQARYVEAVNDCIRIAEESSARFLVTKLEELKVKFLEEII